MLRMCTWKFGRICLIQIKQKSVATLISLTIIAFITVSFLHLRWSFYLKIECVFLSIWDLFHGETAAYTHKRKKKLFKTRRLYLVHKAFIEYITIFFVKPLGPTYKVNRRRVHFAGWRERASEPLLTEPKALLPRPRKMPGKKKKNHRMLVPEGSYSHLLETSLNASAGGFLESPNAAFPL